jgi:hypothetical protein
LRRYRRAFGLAEGLSVLNPGDVRDLIGLVGWTNAGRLMLWTAILSVRMPTDCRGDARSHTLPDRRLVAGALEQDHPRFQLCDDSID